MSLSCLVYVGLANTEMSDQDLKALLKIAREENKQLGITGLLLYRDGFFFQALEGEEDKIDELFAKIRRDPRLHGVTPIYKKPIKERSFPDWSMGFSHMPDSALEHAEGFSTFLENPSAEYFTKNPSYAQALLENFRADIVFS
ncbi:MAG: BLUF domain-containing protein [Methylocella sp.]